MSVVGPLPMPPVITVGDIENAESRVRKFLRPTPLRRYPALDRFIGNGVTAFVKLENHQPTGSFKARNSLALMTALTSEERQRGVIAATKGNHGIGLAYYGIRRWAAAFRSQSQGSFLLTERQDAVSSEGTDSRKASKRDGPRECSPT